MTDQERFLLVIEELRELLSRLGDLAGHVVVVGGQVIALEALASGEEGRVRVETGTGTVVDRGFTFEPDLLIDTYEMERYGDALAHVLRELGFHRTGRSYRWAKSARGVEVEIDLFAPPDADEDTLPTPMTKLPGGDLALARATRLTLSVGGRNFEVAVPDPVSFMMMKTIAKKELRPTDTKDTFDLFVYVERHGVESIARALSAYRGGTPLLADLERLFGSECAPGVQDVLAYAETSEEIERQYLVRFIVDLFQELLRTARHP
jgi:hypothetical protein